MNKSDTESIIQFSDRPFRETTNITFEDFVKLYDTSGVDSFEEDPPNGVLTHSEDQTTYIIRLSSTNNEKTTATFNLKLLPNQTHNLSDVSGRMNFFVDNSAGVSTISVTDIAYKIGLIHIAAYASTAATTAANAANAAKTTLPSIEKVTLASTASTAAAAATTAANIAADNINSIRSGTGSVDNTKDVTENIITKLSTAAREDGFLNGLSEGYVKGESDGLLIVATYAIDQVETAVSDSSTSSLNTAVSAARILISPDNITGTNLINTAVSIVNNAAVAANIAYGSVSNSSTASGAITSTKNVITDFGTAFTQIGYLNGLSAGYTNGESTGKVAGIVVTAQYAKEQAENAAAIAARLADDLVRPTQVASDQTVEVGTDAASSIRNLISSNTINGTNLTTLINNASSDARDSANDAISAFKNVQLSTTATNANFSTENLIKDLRIGDTRVGYLQGLSVGYTYGYTNGESTGLVIAAKYAKDQVETAVSAVSVSSTSSLSTAVSVARRIMSPDNDNITGDNLINTAVRIVNNAAVAANIAYDNVSNSSTASGAITSTKNVITDFGTAFTQIGYLNGLSAGYTNGESTGLIIAAKYARDQLETAITDQSFEPSSLSTAVSAARILISPDNITGTNLINTAYTAVNSAAVATNRAFVNVSNSSTSSGAISSTHDVITDFGTAFTKIGYLNGLSAGYTNGYTNGQVAGAAETASAAAAAAVISENDAISEALTTARAAQTATLNAFRIVENSSSSSVEVINALISVCKSSNDASTASENAETAYNAMVKAANDSNTNDDTDTINALTNALGNKNSAASAAADALIGYNQSIQLAKGKLTISSP